jgi:hypothetical protein
VEQPDANRTREEFHRLLERHPPSLRGVLALDPSLLGNPAFLAPYPNLSGYLTAHPEIARNPAYFVGDGPRQFDNPERRAAELWRDVFQATAVLTGLGFFFGLLIWLVRTAIDYRRWSRLSKVQTEVHTKLLDRFTANADLLSYIQSPAGSKFLESSPIRLDAGPRSIGAPLSRILWSLQGGFVLIAAGIGLQVISGRVGTEAAQPLGAMGIIALAVGIGFLVSAVASYFLSWRLGLIESARQNPRSEAPNAY